MTDQDHARRSKIGLWVIVFGVGLVVGLVFLYDEFTNNVQSNFSQNYAEGEACQARAHIAQALSPHIKGEVAAVQLAESPQYVGDLSFTMPNGEETTLAAWQGKVVLLNLWATWCAPCRAEMPHLSELQTELGGDMFEVVAVNVDTGGMEKPKVFLEDINVANLALYADGPDRIFNMLRSRGLARGMPTTLVVDQHGCQLAHLSGPAHWASPDAVELLKTVMDKGA